MKKAAVTSVALFCFLLAASAHAIPINITSSGMEVVDPASFILHNVLVGPKLYRVDFSWNPSTNLFYPTGYTLEIPAFKAWEYFPLHVGDTWTYRRHDGGIVTVTIAGIDSICGVPCMRREYSTGTKEWWVSDSTGIWLAKVQNPDNSYVLFCPLKLCNPYTYVGFSKLTPYEDVPIYDPYGTLVGTMTGYFSYTGVAVETVVTPAGTFMDARRCNMAQSYTNPWTSNMTTDDIWFSPGVGIVKIMSNDVASSGGIMTYSYSEVLLLESATVGGVSYP
ncbi:MAG: hypothetical protein C4520_06835 [Candidatus Abyssobacteria bacterium SURF_5]|uniref:Uncharacterized protein n=1 Tax=Abyssobacteria bacterium (strain SURF_5) TaxID=2093360 RepID=A0A3A4NRD4_ABYX5|nr:MAG: hypothetical protein C4520_06835 [Candidatus Abyssubacteria bacterium SURF_5]